MNRKKLLIGIFTFCFLMISNSQAAEDSVYVNLSVLDGLASPMPNGSIQHQQPLFPIVKKATAVKTKKVVKKPIEQKSKVKVDVINESKTEPLSQQVVSDTVNETAKPLLTQENKLPNKVQQIPYVENDEQVIVVDVEPVSPSKASRSLEKLDTPTSNQQEQIIAEVAPNTTSVEETPGLLIDENKTFDKQTVSHKLVFAADVDELTPEQQKQIDEIISSFADASHNKIAIYSYNLDDGVDTFKKKRLSLNRAVAVRSYLLPKGYKNFSIKVVNVDSTSDKGNCVEIEELKN